VEGNGTGVESFDDLRGPWLLPARLAFCVCIATTVEGRLKPQTHCHRPERLALRLNHFQSECSRSFTWSHIRKTPAAKLFLDLFVIVS
jgi:hypothetical protein